MPLKTEALEEPHINLTPLVDVVFNLLLFLMLATRFASDEADKQFNVQLATAANAKPLTSLPDELVINVSPGNQIYLNNKLTKLPELETALVAAKKNYADQAVVIRGDGQGPYQNIVDVLAVCDRAKINVVSLPVRLKTEGQK